MARSRWVSAGTLLLAALLLLLPLWALSTTAKASVVLAGAMAFAALPAAYLLDRRGWLTPRRMQLLVGLSLAAGIFSILTGDRNGLTDEPYTTGRYTALFPDLYGHALGALSYEQFGRTVSVGPTYYVYLPFLTLLTVPGIDYRWVALGAWLGMVLWVRHRPFAVAALGAPYVAVLAANGFNDLVPLFLLTVAFAGTPGVASRVSLVLSLGTKQFCGAIAVLYYALRRDWRMALLSGGLSVAFLVPFFLLSPSGTYCHAVLSNPLPCDGSTGILSSRVSVSHVNYWLYPLWGVAIFGGSILRWLRSPQFRGLRDRLLPGPRPAPPEASASAGGTRS